jgi:hypothetical protein
MARRLTKREKNVISRLSPPDDQVFARIAITHVELHNCIYNITSDFTDFDYVLVNTGTNVSTPSTASLHAMGQ